MIPVEYLWGVLIFVFAMIGLVRGLWKEMGTATILLLSLAALNLGQRLILDNLLSGSDGGGLGNLSAEAVLAIYYGATILFVAFISYQGVVLEFPVRKQTGVIKWFFGFLSWSFASFFLYFFNLLRLYYLFCNSFKIRSRFFYFF